MYEVQIARDALRVLLRMPQNQAALIRRKIDQVAADPHGANANVRTLTGRPGFRLRVGDWRVIYDLDDTLRILAVERVAPRGSAYR